MLGTGSGCRARDETSADTSRGGAAERSRRLRKRLRRGCGAGETGSASMEAEERRR